MPGHSLGGGGGGGLYDSRGGVRGSLYKTHRQILIGLLLLDFNGLLLQLSLHATFNKHLTVCTI